MTIEQGFTLMALVLITIALYVCADWIDTLERRVEELEAKQGSATQLLTPEARTAKEKRLATIVNQLTDQLYDRNPDRFKQLLKQASQLEMELGL